MSKAAEISALHVKAFCSEVVENAVPIQVPCAPAAGAQELDCFPTVDQYVVRNGGERVLGWAIWEAPGILIEAEFHAVWRDPSTGSLLDVAAHQMPFSYITFLPDPRRQYLGRQVENVRKPLTEDPKVRQFIYLLKRQFEILNAGDRAEQHAVILPPGERKEYDRLMQELSLLARRIFKS